MKESNVLDVVIKLAIFLIIQANLFGFDQVVTFVGELVVTATIDNIPLATAKKDKMKENVTRFGRNECEHLKQSIDDNCK